MIEILAWAGGVVVVVAVGLVLLDRYLSKHS